MKIVKYFIVGGVAAGVDIGLFTLCANYLGYPYLIVGFCTFILATLTNYLLSVRYVFQSGVRFEKRHEVILVYVVSAVGLVINLAVLYVCVEMLALALFFSKIIATGVVFFWNFIARNNFIFKTHHA
jgi:putative flippase GtrA